MMCSGSFADEDVAEAVRKGEPSSSQSVVLLCQLSMTTKLSNCAKVAKVPEQSSTTI